MGWGTLPKVWDGSRDHPIGPERVGGPSQRSRTGWRSLRGLGHIGGHSRRVEMGRGKFLKVQDGSEDPLGGLGRVRVPSLRLGTGRGTLPTV